MSSFQKPYKSRFIANSIPVNILKRATISPPAKRHLMAFCWRADSGPILCVGWDVVYSKTCVKRPLSKRPKIGFQDQLSLNAGQNIAFCNAFDIH